MFFVVDLIYEILQRASHGRNNFSITSPCIRYLTIMCHYLSLYSRMWCFLLNLHVLVAIQVQSILQTFHSIMNNLIKKSRIPSVIILNDDNWVSLGNPLLIKKTSKVNEQNLCVDIEWHLGLSIKHFTT